MRKIILFGLLTFCSFVGFATHNRAGEILYVRIPPFTANVGGQVVQVYTYSFTVIHYTNYGPNIADRCVDTLHFGDGTSAVAPRINGGIALGCQCDPPAQCGEIIIDIQNGIDYVVKKNIYVFIHTYAGPGTYTVWEEDPNRNAGVCNMTQSVNQPFYVESLLIINSFTGANSSPQFMFDPIDRACINQCFYHNPGAYDADGDSLSFVLTYCRQSTGLMCDNWVAPAPAGPNGTYNINAVSGTLTWCSPTLVCEYNLAFICYEWRKNTSGHYEVIGYVERDMQVITEACADSPPNIVVPTNTCVQAGAVITQNISVTDSPQNNFVELTGGGGAFLAVAPAAVLTNTAAPTPYTANFTWQTTCDHIREQPYICVFKAVEQDNNAVSLVYFTSYNITVVPPSVKNVVAAPLGSNMQISWSPSACNPPTNPITGYKVYRRNDCSALIYNPCTTGVDPALGYTYLGQTTGSVTVFIDTNGGNGLVVGQDYSYLVIAVYTDGSQSFASTQVCAQLKRDVPVILNVDILSTSATTGSVFVRWARPLKTTGNLDTLVFPGPYTFNLKWKTSATATYSTVFTSTANFLYQLDTAYTHINVNTVNTDEEYQVDFISGNTTIGSSQKATSVFLSSTPTDRRVNLQWVSTTPWINDTFTVYRQEPTGGSYHVIGTTTATNYVDSNNVVNRYTYCYKILSNGQYSDPSIYKPLLNHSQEVCATAIDNVIPCTPIITITSDCPLGNIQVSWNNVALSCSKDVLKYVLFKKETVDAQYVKIDTLYGARDTSYIFDGLNLIANCFAIQAVDSSGNASVLSPDYCVDNCPEFDLPNIITMNGDNINDFFKAIRVRQIQKIDLNVFDRWGNLVYKTTDPYFKWDGVSIISNRPVSEGTLFYICDVYEPRVTGLKKINLTGWLQVMK